MIKRNALDDKITRGLIERRSLIIDVEINRKITNIREIQDKVRNENTHNNISSNAILYNSDNKFNNILQYNKLILLLKYIS